jgi:hypothetical protein
MRTAGSTMQRAEISKRQGFDSPALVLQHQNNDRTDEVAPSRQPK